MECLDNQIIKKSNKISLKWDLDVPDLCGWENIRICYFTTKKATRISGFRCEVRISGLVNRYCYKSGALRNTMLHSITIRIYVPYLIINCLTDLTDFPLSRSTYTPGSSWILMFIVDSCDAP